SISYTPLNNALPLSIIAGILESRQNMSKITVYMAANDIIDGLINITVKKTSNYMLKTSIPIKLIPKHKVTMTRSNLQVAYSLIKGDHSNRESRREISHADYTLIIITSQTVKPNDILLIDVTLNMTKKDKIQPLYIYPAIKRIPSFIEEPPAAIEFLINATNNGRTRWETPPSKLTFVIPGAYITGRTPLGDSQYYFSLILYLYNIENLTIKNINVLKYTITASSTTITKESRTSINFIYTLSLLSIISLTAIFIFSIKYKSLLKINKNIKQV
ncbi:MAG: hypothetical protein F7C81_03010, partial [Desulfurococcales archaeon]|nr:hypothetical protein [Desulfurococcales archaeon]